MSGISTPEYSFEFNGVERPARQITPVVILDQSTGGPIIDVSSWGIAPLTSKTYTYYTAPDLVNNPSGRARNLKFITYVYDGVDVYRSQFAYNSDDDVVSITSVAV